MNVILYELPVNLSERILTIQNVRVFLPDGEECSLLRKVKIEIDVDDMIAYLITERYLQEDNGQIMIDGNEPVVVEERYLIENDPDQIIRIKAYGPLTDWWDGRVATPAFGLVSIKALSTVTKMAIMAEKKTRKLPVFSKTPLRLT